MKKTAGLLLASLILIAALSACTRNNGDIGPLFGTWRLEQMKANGTPVELYDSETLLYSWAFQSSIVAIQTILPHNNTRRALGTWEKDDDKHLTLDFGYTDIDGKLNHTPPAPLHLNSDGPTRLEIITFSGNRLNLRQTASDGITYDYSLRKAY